MKITHHLDTATLMTCAAGSQPEALAAVVSSHLAVCPACRAELGDLSLIGEALFEGLDPAAVEREAPVVALRAAEADADTPAPSDTLADTDIPAPLRNVLKGRLEDVPWRRLAPGVWHHPICLSAGSEGDLRLIKVAPGVALPEHGHGGSELTLVLSGRYTDAFGTFGPGDVADLGDDVEHRPVADPLEGCICLVASERKARFRSMLARIAQPFTGL